MGGHIGINLRKPLFWMTEVIMILHIPLSSGGLDHLGRLVLTLIKADGTFILRQKCIRFSGRMIPLWSNSLRVLSLSQLAMLYNWRSKELRLTYMLTVFYC